MSSEDGKNAELVEHLAELRARLVRSVIYLTVGTAAAWCFYDWLFDFLKRPMMVAMEDLQASFLLTSFPEAFMIRLQVCVVAGLIAASPLVFFEVWSFIAPGLTRDERRPVRWIVPMAAGLFLAGVTVCYFTLPKAFEWFVGYVPAGAEFRPSLQGSVLFAVKMHFAFGVVFELPVLLMLLAKMGLVDSRTLLASWRGALVAAAVVSAVITPSGDAFTMLVMAAPVSVLYFVSILLVKMVEGSVSPFGFLSRFSGRFKRRAD